jgi:hypothetical protein
MQSILGKGVAGLEGKRLQKKIQLMGIELNKTIGRKIDWTKVLERRFSLSEANRDFFKSLNFFPSKGLAATRSNCQVKPLSQGRIFYGCKADGCLKLVIVDSGRIGIERLAGEKFIYLPSIKFSLTDTELKFKADLPGLTYDMASHAVDRIDGLEETRAYVCRNTIEFLGYRLSADEVPPVDWLSYFGEKRIVVCNSNRKFFNTRFSLSLKRLLGSTCPRIATGARFEGTKEGLVVSVEVIASGVAQVDFKFESAQGIKYIVAFAQTTFSFDEDNCKTAENILEVEIIKESKEV